ncbi:heme ABC transporter ATP-binding protein [Lewinella sp. IMCC34183]|uniref:heme ABC transporter ATP-binding protein n=1 Tax=Lewinella sp. IMCC34183 TaxID=2248762 RepID=UPI000E26EF7D|nr:heme ABC transporter ATP-binding protein [Lewinella sp. IMCC34183]
MISLENVSFAVKKKELVREVSAEFAPGKMHLILGPNGAGKSTLVRLISGELAPSTGAIHFDGTNLRDLSLLQQARRRAVLSQNLELTFPLSVGEVVMLGRYPHFTDRPRAEDLAIREEAMRLFGVLAMQDRNYLTLSGGEKQRVQFARVFAQIWTAVADRPRLLLLDEPLTFLDIFYQYDLMRKIRDFMSGNPGLTVIGVVHDINIAAKFADQILLLRNGTVFAHGDPRTVLTEKSILEVFRVVIQDRFEIN